MPICPNSILRVAASSNMQFNIRSTGGSIEIPAAELNSKSITSYPHNNVKAMEAS